mgnify:CR=1 FL=1
MAGLLASLTGWARPNGRSRYPALDAAGLGHEALAAIVENAADPIMISGPAGEVYYANTAYLTMAGLTHDCFVAPGVSTFVRGDEGQADRLYRLQKAARNKIPAEEVLSVGAGNAMRLYDVRVSPLGGGKSASFWIFHARPERQAQPVALNQVYDIVDKAPAGFLAVKANGVILYANQIFADWAGVQQQKIMTDGISVYTLIEGVPDPWRQDALAADFGITKAALRTGDNGVLPVTLIYFLKRESNGELAEMYMVLSKQHAQAGIGTDGAESRFFRLFDIAPVGIVIVDQDAKILEQNAAFQLRFHENSEY